MAKILLVAPSLSYSSAARQLALLAQQLPQHGHDVHVCVLGCATPLVASLRQAGIQVQTLGWKHLLSFSALWQLRQLLQTIQPDLLHVWRPQALRAVRIALGTQKSPPLIVSAPLTAHARGTDLFWLDRWLMRKVQRVVVSSTAEAIRCQELGLRACKLDVVPPGAAPPALTRPLLERQYVLCIGPIEPHKGFHDAVWAFDAIHYIYPQLRLKLVGAGTEVPRLQRFIDCLQASTYIELPGCQADLTPLWNDARVAWVPSRSTGGSQVALEALAAGVPVIAAQTPSLSELLRHQETALLFKPGDKLALSSATQRLLEDGALSQRLADAGRAHVAQYYANDLLAARYDKVYRTVA